MIILDRKNNEPLYMQIYAQIKEEILNGIIKEGQVLTGSRGLAGILGVSRNTVNSAYGQLAAEGYIIPQKGIGYTAAKVPELTVSRERPVQARLKQAMPVERKQPDILYDLTNSSQTSDLFPKRFWKRCTLECLDMLENEARISSCQDKQGELYLRKNLLSYLQRIRGVSCDEDQIIITCGIQQSLDLSLIHISEPTRH